MILSRSNNCPNCGDGHQNSCFIEYDSGYHCYSCGYNKSLGKCYYKTPALKLVSETRNLWVPEYTINPKEFSTQCLLWLYNYFISDLEIRNYNIAYCMPQADKPESLLFLILKENQVVDYQRRFFPKGFYSTSTIKKNPVVLSPISTKNLCVVEDYISAVRVSKHMPTLPLFGTSINNINLYHITQNYDNVLVWLDPDAPGITAANNIYNLLTKEYLNLRLENAYKQKRTTSVQLVLSSAQPKELSNSQIGDYIEKFCV